jgi:hypothetical protein
VQRVFSSNVGFYRPLVTLSFAADRRIWKLNPRGYALTNVMLLTADAALLFVLARRLSLTSAAALFAVAVWVFNFHGINMALLWISGRTALLLCLFSLAAALAWVQRWTVGAALLTLAAMLCKEEAVLLPALFVMIDVFSDGIRGVRTAAATMVLRRSWLLWAAAATYLLARAYSGAFGLADAPAYYQLTFHPRAVMKNAIEYLDRGATWAAVSALLMFLIDPKTPFSGDQRRVVRCGLLWFVCLYAITIFIPTRSSLYAVAPSIGSALAAASFASRAQDAAGRRFARVCTALMAAIALLIPVYRMRNHGLIDPADLSTQAIAEIQRAAQGQPHLREIVLLDDPGAPVTLQDAFGALAPDAMHLFVSPQVRVNIADPRYHADENDDATVFQLRRGHLVHDGP